MSRKNIPVSKQGDFNTDGDLNSIDIIEGLQIFTNGSREGNYLESDIDGNERVDMKDTLTLMRMIKEQNSLQSN